MNLGQLTYHVKSLQQRLDTMQRLLVTDLGQWGGLVGFKTFRGNTSAPSLLSEQNLLWEYTKEKSESITLNASNKAQITLSGGGLYLIVGKVGVNHALATYGVVRMFESINGGGSFTEVIDQRATTLLGDGAASEDGVTIPFIATYSNDLEAILEFRSYVSGVGVTSAPNNTYTRLFIGQIA